MNSPKTNNNNLIVESERLSFNNLNDKLLGSKVGVKINESARGLKNREKGLNLLISSWDNNKFFENFSKELNDIERINDRVEREIEQKINQRIQRYGIDSKKILGRDVQLPPRDLTDLRNEFQSDQSKSPRNHLSPPITLENR